MIKYSYLFFLLLSLFFGCASPSGKLSKEYDLLSRQIEGLEQERNALINLEYAAKNLVKAREEYKSRKNNLTNIKEKHKVQGLPTGSPIEGEMSLDDEIIVLKKHQDVLSDEIRKLEKKKTIVVKEQMAN